MGGLVLFVLGFFSFLLLFLFLGIFFLLGVTLVKVLSLCPVTLIILLLCLGALVNPSTLLLTVHVHRIDPLSVFFLSEALRVNVKLEIRYSIVHKPQNDGE